MLNINLFVYLHKNNCIFASLNIIINFNTVIIMKKDSEALAEFLNGFKSRYERLLAQEKICKECLVPAYTVRNWKYGLSRIPELHKCKIEEIFGIKIFTRITN